MDSYEKPKESYRTRPYDDAKKRATTPRSPEITSVVLHLLFAVPEMLGDTYTRILLDELSKSLQELQPNKYKGEKLPFSPVNATKIKKAVEDARNIVGEIYKDDERLTAGPASPDSGVARETDIVFAEVLRHLLN